MDETADEKDDRTGESIQIHILDKYEILKSLLEN